MTILVHQKRDSYSCVGGMLSQESALSGVAGLKITFKNRKEKPQVNKEKKLWPLHLIQTCYNLLAR